jgi:hypothetical protein
MILTDSLARFDTVFRQICIGLGLNMTASGFIIFYKPRDFILFMFEPWKGFGKPLKIREFIHNLLVTLRKS